MSIGEAGFTWDELAAAGILTEVILDHDHVRGIFRMPQFTGMALFIESVAMPLTPALVRDLVAQGYLEPETEERIHMDYSKWHTHECPKCEQTWLCTFCWMPKTMLCDDCDIGDET